MADLIDREEVLDVIFNIMTDNKVRHRSQRCKVLKTKEIV